MSARDVRFQLRKLCRFLTISALSDLFPSAFFVDGQQLRQDAFRSFPRRPTMRDGRDYGGPPPALQPDASVLPP
jgi:hypothetical protein